MNKKILSIIPAKANSRGLPGKNLRLFCGRGLILWSIEASLKSSFITRTVVSSDSDKILTLAQKAGADVIERPTELASDTASCESVMKHAVDYLHGTEGYKPDVLVLLQPTSPLRDSEDIDGALDLYFNSSSSAAISGYELERNPLKEFLINDSGNLNAIMNNKNPFLPRQQLPKAFRPNGAIYVVDRDIFMQTESLLTDKTVPFFMPKERSVDIDDAEDLKLAERYLNKNKTNGANCCADSILGIQI